MADNKLNCFKAVWDAIFARSIAYHPRTQNESEYWSTLPDSDVIGQVKEGLAKLVSVSEPKDLEDPFKLARETLDEVKALTEYQDQKATRLLTVVTFLSALSGVLFVRFVDGYPLRPTIRSEYWDISSWLVFLSYLLFGLFMLLAICGALVTFHATQTQFRYPPSAKSARAKSYLFYRSILEVTPDQWAASFLAPDDPSKLIPDLKLRYFKNYVVESYLVAAKVADKLRYLEAAQTLQSYAIRTLLFWIIIYATTIVVVPAVEKASQAIAAPYSATTPAVTSQTPTDAKDMGPLQHTNPHPTVPK